MRCCMADRGGFIDIMSVDDLVLSACRNMNVVGVKGRSRQTKVNICSKAWICLV